MTKYEVVSRLIDEGSLIVDAGRGIIYTTKAPGHKGIPTKMKGSDHHGYNMVNLRYDGIVKKVLAHQIVWMSVNGAIPEGLMIDHINRDKADNRLANLRITDTYGNADNRERYNGVKNPSCKLTLEQVEEIKNMYPKGNTYRSLAKMFKVSATQIGYIINGYAWTDNWRARRKYLPPKPEIKYIYDMREAR
jgi:hypothetical protein